MESSLQIPVIPVISVKDIDNYIIKNLYLNTFTIYHIIIGSKVHGNDFTSLDPLFKRNHECPEIVKKLLFNPENQFSPEFINSLSNYKEITIKQVLLLIDPYYSRDPKPLGLLSVITENSSIIFPDLSVISKIEYNEISETVIISKLEPFIVPHDINELEVYQILDKIKSLDKYYPMLVNIMDCSSITIPKIYANSINSINSNDNNNIIHITKPECLILDHKIQFNPIITLKKLDCDKGEFIPNDILHVRWVNYNDDNKLLDDLAIVKDFCIYSRNTYDFITTLYKVSTIEYSLLSINKIWGFTTYTMDYKFTLENVYGSSNKEIIINFSKLSFQEFSSYWILQEGFKKLPPFNYDYNLLIVCKFIDYFINKFKNNNIILHLDIELSIVDLLKVEAYEILKNLGKYNENDKKYLDGIDNPEYLDRKIIKTYLNDNGINF